MLLYGRVAHINIYTYNSTHTVLISIYELIYALYLSCVVVMPMLCLCVCLYVCGYVVVCAVSMV